jgi:hypothetical protein
LLPTSITGSWTSERRTSESRSAHIDSLSPKQRQPVLCYTVKGRWFGYRVDETDDMCACELRKKVCSRFRGSCSRQLCANQLSTSSSQEVSTMDVVTFSGVTSGGIVTSGTICWTYAGELAQLFPARREETDICDKRFFDKRSDDGRLANTVWDVSALWPARYCVPAHHRPPTRCVRDPVGACHF